MIQISSPSQVINTLDNSLLIESNAPLDRADSLSGEIEEFQGDLKHKANEENRPGFFAKLLENLTAKSKTGPISESEENVGKNGLNPEKSSHFSVLEQGKIEKTENVSEEIGIFALLRQDASQALLESENRPLRKGIPSVKEHFSGNIKQKDSFDDDQRDIKLLLGRSGSKISESEAFSGEKRTRKGQTEGIERQTASRPLSGDFSEEKILRFAADLKLGDRKGPEHTNVSRSNKGKLNVDFRDLRTGDAKETAAQDSSKGQAVIRSTEVEIPVDLKVSLARAEAETAGKTGREGSQNLTFEDALARELRGNLSTDIVRDATVIARNGGEGIIRLSLRPASLGDVKIRLEMTENKITGLIIVESNEALRAFERELPVLEKAFRDSGFSETNLEMSLAQDESNFAGWNEKNEEDFPVLTPVLASSRYEEGAESTNAPDSSGIIGNEMIVTPGRIPVNLLA